MKKKNIFLHILFVFMLYSTFMHNTFFVSLFAVERKVHIYSQNNVKMGNSYVAVLNSSSSKKSKSEEGECVGYFIKALDRGCYNNTNSRIGVYADCAGYSSTELFDVIDANFAYVVPYSESSNIYSKCKNYKSVAISQFLRQKDIIEKAARKTSPECLKAKNELDSAKKCYTAVMASSGSFLDPLPECDTVVGRKIRNAGKYGYSDLTSVSLNIASGQLTDKRPNWREAVEQVFAGYLMQAQAICEEETFSNLSINRFTPDNQSNFVKDYLSKSFYGSNNNTNSDTADLLQKNSSNDITSIDSEINGSIFTIDAEVIALSKGRLEMILSNPSFYDISNSVDITIAKNIYGTLITASNKALFIKYINDLSGKVNIFVIKSRNGNDRECAIYKAIGGQVISIPAEDSIASKKIHSYIGGCDVLKAY